MPFINHENHIKKRASLTPSVTRSIQGLGVFCTLFRIKKQMMFDTLPSPQEKKENIPSTRQIWFTITLYYWMRSVGRKLEIVYMPFSLMVMNLGFWRGGIYNLPFPFSLLEHKNMLLLSWEINLQFIIHQRNCSTVFLKHRVPAHVKQFRIVFEKGFLSFISIGGLGQQFCLWEFRNRTCLYLEVWGGEGGGLWRHSCLWS